MESPGFVSIRITLKAVLLASLLVLSACNPKALELSVESSSVIEGKVSLSASAMSDLGVMSTCEGPTASIYEIDADGSKKEPALMSTAVNASTGVYRFENVKSKGVQSVKDANVKYLIEVLTCNNKVYQRTITGNKTQNISFGTDLISQALVVAAFGGKDISTIHREKLVALTASLEVKNPSDLADLYAQAVADAAISSEFQSLLGFSLVSMANVPPRVIPPVISGGLSEASVLAKSVTASHWLPSYSIVYDWKWDGVQISTTDSISKTIGKNEQGSRQLILRVGKDDGGGAVDTTKPYFSKTWNLTVNNNYFPTPPSISVASSITASSTISVDINTGVGLANCETFSSMALTEDNPTAPSAGAFNITCASGPTQAQSFNLNVANGTKTLRLWVKDSAGVVSILPEMALITLDNQNPTVSLTSLNSGSYQGGSAQSITWSANDTGVGVASNGISLQYSSNNGVAWNNIALSQTNSGSYAWTLPAINSTQVLVKVIVVDGVANSASAVSAASLTVDSTVPTLSLTSMNSGAYQGGTSQNITWTSADAGVGLAASPITLEYTADNGTTWNSIATGLTNTGTYSWTLPNITSTQVKVRVTSVDGVGNTNTAVSSSSMTIDTSGPSLSLTSLNSGSYKGGTSQNITWTASDADAGLGATPISLAYSTDNGSTWTSITAATANDGTEAWTLPSVDNNTVKVRVVATDNVGNTTTVISSSAFTIDSTAPAIATTTINDGATYAGTALINIKTDITDNYSTLTQISVRLANANASTNDCQSEYANNNWVSYTNATTNLGFTITPVDGTKKICVWAKDSAGNISSISPSSGTAGVNTDSIIYQLGSPPEITQFSAYRTSDSAVTGITVGQAMTISYTISDVEGLDNNPISIAYTTNNSLWKDIVTDQDISNLNQMTWIGGLSGNPATTTATYTSWTAPSAGIFRLKAMAKDMSGNISIVAMSGALNASNWSIYAGTTDRGDGGTGRAALILTDPYNSPFAINPKNGDVYAVDSGLAIRKLDAKTGIVKSVIFHGTTNLPDDGPMPSPPRMNVDHMTALTFDNQGRMYASRNLGDSRIALYQIDFDNNYVRRYLGGSGWDVADGSNRLNVPIGGGNIGIDEDNTIYFFAWCGGSPVNINTSAQNLLKLTQNPDGTAGTVSHVAGNCTKANPSVFGVSAATSPLSTNSYPSLGAIVAWDHGQNIYYSGYGTPKYKIINGNIHSTTIPSNFRSAWLMYNPTDGKIYSSNTTGGINKTTPSLAGNGGEVVTTWFNGNSTTSACNVDGVDIANYCGTADIRATVNNGMVFFADGAVSNSASNYSIRYVDPSNKIQTLMGSLPLYGEGKDKSLVRGGIAGIYYKTASEPNQAAFPEGLYFMEKSGASFNYIHPTTGVVQTLWGNQSRSNYAFSNGETISKNISMGMAYSGGNAIPLMFDNTGLPWMRANSQLIKINASNQIEYKTSGAAYWQDLNDASSPALARMKVYGGYTNITLKDQGFFGIGADYAALGATPPINPFVTIRLLDFTGLTSIKIFGGSSLYSNSTAQAADAGAGQVVNTNMWYSCGTGTTCFSHYDATNDRLYFSENAKIRYITTPSNTATATLVTAHTHATIVSNLILRPDGSQIWYRGNGSNLYCKDISSGKSWCDGTTNHFATMNSAGYGLSSVANQFTWKDNNTMLISNGAGLIYQFNLPTGP